MAARIPWVIRDLVANEEYAWEVNPKQADAGRSKNFIYEASAAPNGKAVILEGRDEVRRIVYSGVVLTQDQYDEMLRWFNKKNELELEDDLGNVYTVYITSFNPKRERSNNFPWKHSTALS